MQSRNKAFEEWAKNQPIWYDIDMLKSLTFGIAVGVFVGFLVGYSVGLPDFSNMPITYVRG
jgi:formate-dependent nitrite reductase membrane component NrfD